MDVSAENLRLSAVTFFFFDRKPIAAFYAIPVVRLAKSFSRLIFMIWRGFACEIYVHRGGAHANFRDAAIQCAIYSDLTMRDPVQCFQLSLFVAHS